MHLHTSTADDEESLVYASAMDKFQRLPLSQLQPSPDNPRQHFGDLSELADSLRAQGLIEPIIIRKREDGELEIVAGHRRARAAKLAGLKEVDVVVRDWTRQEALEAALVENTQRESLNPLETARGYAKLLTEFGLKAEDAAKRMGVSRASFFLTKSLLDLPDEAKKAVEAGLLPPTQAAELVRVRGSERVKARAFEDVMKLAKNGEPPPIRAVRKLIQERYLGKAKRGVSKAQREVATDVDLVVRRRSTWRVLDLIGDLVERRPHLSEVDLRFLVMALGDITGDSAREVVTRRGLKLNRPSAIGTSQLRSLVMQLALAPFVRLVDGDYSPGLKAVAKAYGLSLAEIEKTVIAVLKAEGLFEKE